MGSGERRLLAQIEQGPLLTPSTQSTMAELLQSGARAYLQFSVGRFELLNDYLQAALPACKPFPLLSGQHRNLLFYLALTRGNPTQAFRFLDATLEECDSLPSEVADPVRGLTNIAVQVAGAILPLNPDFERILASSSFHLEAVTLFSNQPRQLAKRMYRESLCASGAPQVPHPAPALSWEYARLHRATRVIALVRNKQTETAAVEAAALVVEASHLGDVYFSCEAAMHQLEALLVARSFGEVPSLLAELAKWTAHMGGSRYELEESFARAWLEESPIPRLEELASHQALLPAVRRARIALGMACDEATPYDREIVQSLLQGASVATLFETSTRPALTLDQDPHQPAWTIDSVNQQLCLHTGAVRDLRKSPAGLTLLAALFRAGGRMEYEEAARTLWPTDTYHPFEHGPRLRALVHRLRASIGPVLGDCYIVTMDEVGYALGHQPVRLLQKITD
jgi:hypothetical protein